MSVPERHAAFEKGRIEIHCRAVLKKSFGLNESQQNENTCLKKIHIMQIILLLLPLSIIVEAESVGEDMQQRVSDRIKELMRLYMGYHLIQLTYTVPH